MLSNNNKNKACSTNDDDDNDRPEIQPAADAQNTSTIKLKEAFFLLAKIQDTFAFLPATERKQSSNDNVNKIRELALALVTNIVASSFKAERNKIIRIANELRIINASACSVVMSVLTQPDILKIEEKIKTRASERVCQDDETALPFAALHHRIIATRQEVTSKLNDLLMQRKTTEAEKSKIDLCLARIDADEDLFTAEVTVNWTNEKIAGINSVISDLAKQFPALLNISLVNRAFDEIQKVSDAVREYQLTEADYAMMQRIIKLYSANYPAQVYKASVNAAIMASRQVRPIYLFDLQSIIAFSHTLTARNNFLVGSFNSSGQPVYSVYDGLVSLCFGYEDLITYFAQMIEQLRKDSEVKNIGDDTKQALQRYITDLEKYKSYFAKYFQIGMRFVMPLESYRAALVKCEEQLQASASYSAFSRSMRELDQCIAILKQKSLAINLMMEIRVFCDDIEKLIPQQLRAKLLRNNIKNLFSNKICTVEDGILITIKNYFDILLGSRFVDNCTNLQAVLDQLNKIFADAGFDPSKQEAALANGKLKPLEKQKSILILTIHRKIEKRLLELQSDVKVENRQ